MGIKDKVKKIKQMDLWKPDDNEKTGVVNGLILLGAALGASLSLQGHDACADEPACSGDEWGNWSDWTNSWSNWADWSNWSDWTDWGHGDWGHSRSST